MGIKSWPLCSSRPGWEFSFCSGVGVEIGLRDSPSPAYSNYWQENNKKVKKVLPKTADQREMHLQDATEDRRRKNPNRVSIRGDLLNYLKYSWYFFSVSPDHITLGNLSNMKQFAE